MEFECEFDIYMYIFVLNLQNNFIFSLNFFLLTVFRNGSILDIQTPVHVADTETEVTMPEVNQPSAER